MPIRVLCVDDNPLVVDALGLKLNLSGGFEWLVPLEAADNLLDDVLASQPDVVLLDIDMPGRDPLDALAELTAACPCVKVLMFSGHTRTDLVDRAIEAGAWGYLSKHADVQTIVSAIRRVAAGEFLLDPDFKVASA
ncbi:MAG: response regulator transcription factor [Phycisphaerae bacterium]|nr:response regulator transcription factor [Phycisphaerae bacterium]